MQQRMPYTLARSGLLTIINKKYAYPGNITKIPTPTEISPYLQIITIKNAPLQPWLILHMYMPSHLDIRIRLSVRSRTGIRIVVGPLAELFRVLC